MEQPPFKVSRFGFRRRRRIRFLLAELDAPTGVSRPVARLEAELDLLIARELGED
jgi:hypothetical protein